jgi:IMP dehydrogenase/GMP reductase
MAAAAGLTEAMSTALAAAAADVKVEATGGLTAAKADAMAGTKTEEGEGVMAGWMLASTRASLGSRVAKGRPEDLRVMCWPEPCGLNPKP